MIQYLKLGSLTRIRTGKLDANAADDNGTYPFFTCSREPLSINTCSYDCECVLVAGNGDLNVKYYDGKFDAYQRTYIIESLDKTKLMVKYLYYFLDLYVEILRQQAIGGVIKYIKLGNLADAIIPVPVIEKQREIIEIFEKCNGTIAYRQQELLLLDQLVKSRFIEMFGDPKNNPNGYLKKRLKDTCRVITGNTPSRAVSEYYGNSIEWIKTDNIVEGMLHPTIATESLSEKGLDVGRTVESDSILMACIAGSLSSIGRVCVTDRKVAFNQQINAIEPNDYNALFLYVMLQLSKEYLIEEINMALKGILSKSKLEGKVFIVPPMDLQQQFAAFVEQVDKSKFYIVQMQILLRLLIRVIQQKTTEVLL